MNTNLLKLLTVLSFVGFWSLDNALAAQQSQYVSSNDQQQGRYTQRRALPQPWAYDYGDDGYEGSQQDMENDILNNPDALD